MKNFLLVFTKIILSWSGGKKELAMGFQEISKKKTIYTALHPYMEGRGEDLKKKKLSQRIVKTSFLAHARRIEEFSKIIYNQSYQQNSQSVKRVFALSLSVLLSSPICLVLLYLLLL